MPNVITPFGFVKKSGDVMTGDLNMGLNSLIMHDTVTGCLLRGSQVSADRFDIRNMVNNNPASVTVNDIIGYGHYTTQVGKLIDTVDVSEIGKPAGGLYLASNQLNIPNATPTFVELETILPNFGDGVEDTVNHKITPGVAGFYMVVGQITYTSVVADKLYKVQIIKGAATILAESFTHAALANDVTVKVGIVAYLQSDDYLRLRAYHSAGVGTVDILNGAPDTFLTLERLR